MEIKRKFVMFAYWCGWLHFVDQKIIQAYLQRAEEKSR